MSFEQIKGIVERILTLVVGWAVGAGYVPPGLGQELVLLLLAALQLWWGWHINQAPQLAKALRASEPETVVISTPAVAKATPNDSKIISSEAPKPVIEAAVDDVRRGAAERFG